MTDFPTQKENEWIKPVMKNYLAQCCDCGLIHEIDFRVVRLIDDSNPDEREYELVEDCEVQFRVRRKDD